MQKLLDTSGDISRLLRLAEEMGPNGGDALLSSLRKRLQKHLGQNESAAA